MTFTLLLYKIGWDHCERFGFCYCNMSNASGLCNIALRWAVNIFHFKPIFLATFVAQNMGLKWEISHRIVDNSSSCLVLQKVKHFCFKSTCLWLHLYGLKIFHVNPRFHHIHVGWNLGLTWKIATPAFVALDVDLKLKRWAVVGRAADKLAIEMHTCAGAGRSNQVSRTWTNIGWINGCARCIAMLLPTALYSIIQSTFLAPRVKQISRSSIPCSHTMLLNIW